MRGLLRAKSWRSRPGQVVLFWLAASVCGGAASPPAAHGKRRPAKPEGQESATANEASQLVQQGVMALLIRDFAAAYRALSAAYRLQPSVETLYQLGVTALSSGDSVSAQDLMRRYLAEAGPQADAARRAEAQRIATRPQTASGEVSVVGPPGAFVLVDERLVGQLPLSRALLLAVGYHVLALDRAGVISPGRIEIKSGQSLEARLTDDATALQARQLPAVFVTGGPEAVPSTRAVIDAALTAAGLSIFDAESHNGMLPPAECAKERACLLRWAAAQGVQYALELSATAAPCAVRVSLLDVAIAEAASERTAACTGDGGSEHALGEILPSLLRLGLDRPRGVLRVTSQPAGADVMVGGRSIGTTPLERPSFASPLELAVELPGFHRETRHVQVAADTATPVQVTLTALPPPKVKVLVWERHRPRWRIALGIASLAIGAGLVGFGSSALAVDGSCVQDPVAPSRACEQRYATSTTGIALLVPGAVLLGAGIAALAIPGPRRQVEYIVPGPEASGRASALAVVGAF